MELAGRRALVTGASRGIGAALAAELRARGADVALVARPSDDLDRHAEAIGGVAYPCDLLDRDAVAGLISRVEQDGPVDVLVNNAGMSVVGWFGDRTHDELDRVLDLNLRAPMHLCRDVIPGMLARGRGHIVNISSMASVFSPPGLTAYGATKAGLSHFTSGLRADLRDDPITMTTVTLGSVDTEMDQQSRAYGPLRMLAEASDGADLTPMEDLVGAIVAAIEDETDVVDVPEMMKPLSELTHQPRELGAAFFADVPAREPRPD